MIPLTLTLRNFLSYGSEPQTIDFAPHHLICLSGKNGHGKSALLDAMTWALWGIARKTTGAVKADLGLLRLGQQHMMVSFDFLLNTTRYRVRREFSIEHGKHIAYLEFGAVNDRGILVPLTDKTIRSTQALLDQTLGVSYETFVNSAFIRQGQDHEFSKKSPKERKEVLCTILGLSLYDQLREKAYIHIKKLQATIASKQAYIYEQQKELATQQQIITLLEQHKKQLHDCSYTLELKKNSLEQLTQKKLSLQHELQVQKKLEQELIEKQREYTVFTTTITQNIRQWRKQHYEFLQQNTSRLLSTREQLLQQLALTTVSPQEITTVQQAITQATTILNQWKLEYENKQVTLRASYDNSLKRITEQQDQITALITILIHEQDTLKTQLNTHSLNLETILKEPTFNSQDYHILDSRCNRRIAWFHQMSATYQHLQHMISEHHRKLTLLDENNPSCPLCDQSISAARRRYLRAQATENVSLVEHKQYRLKKILPKLKQLILQDQELLSTYKESLQKQTIRNLTQTQLQQQITELEVRIQNISQHIIKHRETITQLENQKLVLHQQLEQELNTHEQIEQQKYVNLADAYNQALKQQDLLHKKILTVEELKKKISNIDQYLDKDSHVTSIKQQQSLQLQHICIALSHARKLKKAIALDTNTIQARQYSDLMLHQILSEHESTSQEIVKLQNQMQQLSASYATTQAQYELLQKIASIVITTQKEIVDAETELHEFQIINTIFGKDGIPALLIEDTIPELETEANYLLGKLTNNNAHIFFESMRDLKKGGIKETLDIKISDATGVRPYEMFSGGEAFRINFALRIALAKLLARRAGTSLQTLIIDEGFGSQDEEGLQYLIDALYTIKDDFSKVIIVSHLPFMKDNFPVHLYVEKYPTGSIVSTVYQG